MLTLTKIFNLIGIETLQQVIEIQEKIAVTKLHNLVTTEPCDLVELDNLAGFICINFLKDETWNRALHLAVLHGKNSNV